MMKYGPINKAVIHPTLNHYEVYGEYLRDILLATAFIGAAIE